MKIDGRRVSHDTLEQIRIACVRLVEQERRTPTQAAREMGVDRRRVYGWLARYRAGGWQALQSRKATGRPKRLDGRQTQWIYKTVTAKSPFQLKVPFALWTRSRIRTLIMRKFAVKLSPVTVGRLLVQLGFSCQKPLFRADRRSVLVIEQWLKKEFPGIRAMAKSDKAEIFYVIESTVSSGYPSGATWIPTDKAIENRSTEQRSDVSMICVVTPKGAMRFMVVQGRVGADDFKEFLKRLMRARRRPAYLIAAGLPTQRSRKVQAYVDSLQGKLRLFFLPAGALSPAKR